MGQRRLRLLWFGSVVFLGVVAAVCTAHIYMARAQEREAVSATANLLLAVKDRDLPRISRLIVSDSGDQFALRGRHRRAMRMVGHTVQLYGLDKITDGEIRRAVRVEPRVPYKLIASMARFHVVSRETRRQIDEHEMGTIVTRYNLRGRDMLSICLKEHGQWRVLGMPGLSARVLRHQTVQEAIDHDDFVEQ